eukprot:2934459-Amphidinium_carterae.5
MLQQGLQDGKQRGGGDRETSLSLDCPTSLGCKTHYLLSLNHLCSGEVMKQLLQEHETQEATPPLVQE